MQDFVMPLKLNPRSASAERSHKRKSEIQNKFNNFDGKNTLTIMCSKHLTAPDFSRGFSPEFCDRSLCSLCQVF
jgi:hypothetical protein